MKKLQLFLFLILLFSACEEKVEFVKLSDSEVTFFYNETKQLTFNYSSDKIKDKTYIYKSIDPTIATINLTGLLTANSVGTTTVILSSTDGTLNDSCKVIVNPKSTLYKEPYIEFGADITQIKSKAIGTLYKENDSTLYYTDGQENVIAIAYYFKSGKSSAILVNLKRTPTLKDDIDLFLKERYLYKGIYENTYNYINRKTGKSIVFNDFTFLNYITVMY